MKEKRLVAKPRPGPANFTAARRSYLGGTDMAPILGVSERRTRFSVWAEKLGRVADEEMGEEAEAGVYMEPLVLRRFATRFRLALDTEPRTYTLTDAPFIAANPDGLVLDKGGHPTAVVDAKTRSPFQRGAWGEAGTSDVPADEMCQVQLYLHVLDLPVAYLAVFFDRALTVFVVPRDRALGTLMVEEAAAFWNDYILTKREPPFEGAAAADYLRWKYPRVKKDLRPAEAPDDLLVARRDLIKRHLVSLKSNLDAVEGSLKARIGVAAGIAGDGYTARWYETGARNGVEWKAVVAELRSFPVVADEETATAIRQQIDTAIARHTTKGEPSRTLKVTFKGPRSLPAVELEPTTPAALPAATEGETNG
jgi:putative phage-type endonuclease